MTPTDPLPPPTDPGIQDATVSFPLIPLCRHAGLPATPESVARVARLVVAGAYASLAAYFGTPSLWEEYQKTRIREDAQHAVDRHVEECFLCHRRRPSGGDIAVTWRIFALRGHPIAVCSRHFAPPGSSETESMEAYGRVLRILEAAT